MQLFRSKKNDNSKSNNRQVRLCENVQQFIAELVSCQSLPPVMIDGVTVAPDPLIIITRANVSPDMKNAKIYVRHFDHEKLELSLKYLNAVKGTVRHLMANQLNMRFTPQLSFHSDVSLEMEKRMDELFTQVATHG